MSFSRRMCYAICDPRSLTANCIEYLLLAIHSKQGFDPPIQTNELVISSFPFSMAIVMLESECLYDLEESEALYLLFVILAQYSDL